MEQEYNYIMYLVIKHKFKQMIIERDRGVKNKFFTIKNITLKPNGELDYAYGIISGRVAYSNYYRSSKSRIYLEGCEWKVIKVLPEDLNVQCEIDIEKNVENEDLK